MLCYPYKKTKKRKASLSCHSNIIMKGIMFELSKFSVIVTLTQHEFDMT